MKRVIIKSVIFLLVLSMSLPIMSAKEERRAEAVAVFDDLLIIVGVSVILGTYSYCSERSGKGAVDSFIDAFGLDTYEKYKRFYNAKEMEEAAIPKRELELKSPSLARAAVKIKSQNKFPVEKTSQGIYRSYDLNGNIVERSSVDDLKSCWGSITGYYMVSSLSDFPFTVNTSGKAVLTEDVLSDLKEAVATVSKPFVQLGKTMIDDIVDFVGASGVFAKNDTSSLAASAKYNEITSKYEGKTALVVNFGNVNAYGSVVSDVTAIAIEGVILELRLQNGSRLFQTMSADRFSEMNDLYSKSGDIHCFSDYMSSSLIFGGLGYMYASGCSDMLYGEYNDNIPSLIEISCSDGNTVFRATSCTANERYCYPPYYRYASIDSGAATFINNGATANYVIGEVGADGTISYSVYGETTEGKFIDGLETGDVSIKVTGDVTVSDRILEQVMDNNLTVEEINEEVANVSENVRVVDHSINNGFEKSYTWYEKIWNAITGIPSAVFDAFKWLFETLFGWLSKILSAILGVPVDIVAELEDIGDFVLDIPGNVADAVGGFFTDILDFLKTIPGEMSAAVDKVGEFMAKIPSEIATGFKDLFMWAFVPDNNFFNNWGDNFKNSLKERLPFDVYNDFFDDIKTIMASKLEDVTITVYGQKVVIFPFSIYYKYEKKFDGIVRGFMFILLVFYNLNQMYFLIRGTKLYHLNAFGFDESFSVKIDSTDSK